MLSPWQYLEWIEIPFTLVPEKTAHPIVQAGYQADISTGAVAEMALRGNARL
jgi:hypothetical protein